MQESRCTRVSEYETLLLTAPLNASAIRRLENTHQGEVAQEDNQAENDEEFNQTPMQNQPQQMRGQMMSEFQRRMEAHSIGVTRWTEEVSPTLYENPPRFTPAFRDFYNQQEDHMSVQCLRGRFASAEEMDNYFFNQDQEKAIRRDHMRTEWTRKNNDFNNTMYNMHNIFRDGNMWKDI